MEEKKMIKNENSPCFLKKYYINFIPGLSKFAFYQLAEKEYFILSNLHSACRQQIILFRIILIK